MRISDWSSDVCSSDLGQVGILSAKVTREKRGSNPHRMVMTFASEKEALIYLWHAGYIPWPNYLPRREGQYVKIRCEPTGPVTIEHMKKQSDIERASCRERGWP